MRAWRRRSGSNTYTSDSAARCFSIRFFASTYSASDRFPSDLFLGFFMNVGNAAASSASLRALRSACAASVMARCFATCSSYMISVRERVSTAAALDLDLASFFLRPGMVVRVLVRCGE